MLRELHRLPDVARFDLHIWVDWIELHCLQSVDRSVSFGDVLDLISGQPAPEEDWEESLELDDLNSMKQRDRHRPMAISVFRVLEHRVAQFAEQYPFTVSNATESAEYQTLDVRDGIDDKHRLYVFLLACSSLRYVDKEEQSALTREFERQSAAALRRMMPAGAEVHVFGTATETGLFTGALNNKVQKLADALNELKHPSFTEQAATDAGDGGLDIVSWVPLGDNQPGMPIMFGQAACTPDWPPKQHSASPSTWRNRITMMAEHSVACCIPFSFRNAQGAWHNTADIQGAILLDRPRLLHLLAGTPPLAAEDLGAGADLIEGLLNPSEDPANGPT